jgi:MFS family permease
VNILAFLRGNARLLVFGFSMCLLSSAGQTFFISLFNGEVRSTFNLSHSELGAMYATGTIASAVTLMFAGRLVDRIAFLCCASRSACR